MVSNASDFSVKWFFALHLYLLTSHRYPDPVLPSAGSQVEKTVKIKQKTSILCCMPTEWALTAQISEVPLIPSLVSRV